MERELNRLQNKVAKQSQTITHLQEDNERLNNEVDNLNHLIKQLREQLGEECPRQYYGDQDTIKTLEAKLSTTTWQLMEVQNCLLNCQDQVKRLENELLISERGFLLTRHQLKQAEQLIKNHKNNTSSAEEEIIKQWEKSMEEKQKLAAQNVQLKAEIFQMQNRYKKEIDRVLKETSQLVEKIQQQQDDQKNKRQQILSIIEELKKENEEVREELKQRNEHICMLMRETEGISTQKSSDMHTIKNLKRELRKKCELVAILGRKLQQNDEIKQRYEQFNEFFEKNYEEYGKISGDYEKLKRQNEVLKIKVREQKQKNDAFKKVLDEERQKIMQLLIENESCHRLLHQVRGRSNLYKSDIQEEVKIFMGELQKRRNMMGTWTDVSELVEMNQRLRMQQYRVSLMSDE